MNRLVPTEVWLYWEIIWRKILECFHQKP